MHSQEAGSTVPGSDLPLTHGRHKEEPAVCWYVFAGHKQALESVLPGGEDINTVSGHPEHTVAPAVSWYVPDEHSVQTVAPDTFEK